MDSKYEDEQFALAEGVSSLIYELLSSSYVYSNNPKDIRDYLAKVRGILINLPHAVITGEIQSEEVILEEINRLDPSSNYDEKWGEWATNLADAFGVELEKTAKTRLTKKN